MIQAETIKKPLKIAYDPGAWQDFKLREGSFKSVICASDPERSGEFEFISQQKTRAEYTSHRMLERLHQGDIVAVIRVQPEVVIKDSELEDLFKRDLEALEDKRAGDYAYLFITNGRVQRRSLESSEFMTNPKEFSEVTRINVNGKTYEDVLDQMKNFFKNIDEMIQRKQKANRLHSILNEVRNRFRANRPLPRNCNGTCS